MAVDMRLRDLFNTGYTTAAAAAAIAVMWAAMVIGADPKQVVFGVAAMLLVFHAGIVAGADIMEREYMHVLALESDETQDAYIHLLAGQRCATHWHVTDGGSPEPCQESLIWAATAFDAIAEDA